MKWIVQFLAMSFIAVGLAGCPANTVKTQAADDSTVQQGYQMREQLTLTRKTLNDLYTQEKIRRTQKPDSPQYISDNTYKSSLKILDQAWELTSQAIAIARKPATAKPGESAANLLEEARIKKAQVDAVNSQQPVPAPK